MSVILGIGCGKNVDANELIALARTAMELGRIAKVDCIATLDTKQGEPAILVLAQTLAAPLRFFDAETLKTETRISVKSDLAQRKVHTPSVAEAAALRAAGIDAELLVPKRKGVHCTAALAGSTSRSEPTKSTSSNPESDRA